MSNELVSIAMAVKNGEKYIREALASIQRQTYSNFECIIVDDYSSDSTPNIILNEFCKNDKRFKLYVNLPDPGKPYIDAHNISYSLCKGKYLFRFDADDIMYPDMLEFQSKFLDENPEYDATCTCVRRMGMNKDTGILEDYIINEQTEKFEHQKLIDSVTPGECKLFNEYPYWEYKTNIFSWFNQSSCIRASFYHRCKPMFTITQMGDYVFWWNMMSLGAKLYKHHEMKLVYRMHPESICHSELFKLYGKEYDLQIAIANYKAITFDFDKDKVYPDGSVACRCAQLFRNTVAYYENVKKANEAK